MKRSSDQTPESRDLELLEVLEQHPDMNQRNLARETSMALGLVNSCLKRLVRKGWVKIQEAPGRRYLYYLTPKGMAEKTSLTYEYICFSVQYYSLARKKCRNLFQKLADQNVTQVSFLGKSDLAEIAYLSLMEFPIEFVAIYEDKEEGAGFFGHTILPLEKLRTSSLQTDHAIVYTRLKPPRKSRDLSGIDYREIF